MGRNGSGCCGEELEPDDTGKNAEDAEDFEDRGGLVVIRHADDGRTYLVIAPGWVRTDMGGPSASRSVAQGADTAVWLANLPEDGPTGGFFRDRKAIAW